MSNYREGLRPDDHRREELLRHLAEYFPSGATPKRFELYITKLRQYRFKIDDVAEGIERVIAVREQQSFPPIAVVIRYCQEARTDRCNAEKASESKEFSGTPRPINQDELERGLAECRELRKALFEKNPDQSALTPLRDCLEPEERSDVVEL